MNLIFTLANLALRVMSLAMLVYCVMSFVMPGSPLHYRLAALVEPVLNPVRRCLYGWFPSLRRMPVDFSPLAVWLLIDIAGRLLYALQRAM